MWRRRRRSMRPARSLRCSSGSSWKTTPKPTPLMWYFTRPLRRSQRLSGIHTRTKRSCPSMTMAFVFTKHSLRPMLVMVPLRGASGVGPKAQDNSARNRVFSLRLIMAFAPRRPGSLLPLVGGDEPDGLDGRVGGGRRGARLLGHVELAHLLVGLDDDLLGVLRARRPREVVALPVLAAQVAQKLQLLLGL